VCGFVVLSAVSEGALDYFASKAYVDAVSDLTHAYHTQLIYYSLAIGGAVLAVALWTIALVYRHLNRRIERLESRVSERDPAGVGRS
jgi:hypothetical protein